MGAGKTTIVGLMIAMLVLAVMPTVVTHAASFNIPEGDVAGLIAAINTANGNGEADTIDLADGGTYTLTTVDNNTDGANGLPSITSDITINGNGATIERSSAGGTPGFRIFHVGSGDLALNNVTIRGGHTEEGGGIWNDGTLTIDSGTVSGNTAELYGGGIINRGTLRLTDSAVSDNTSGNDGGGIRNDQGSVDLINSTVTGNFCGCKFQGGGGIRNGAELTLTESIVNDNFSELNGGGVFSTGMLTVISSTVSGNTAVGGGGGILNHTGTMTITESTLNGNSASIGGGIAGGTSATTEIIRVTVSGNIVDCQGGGIANVTGASMTIRESMVSGNTAECIGGGIANLNANLTILNSTISGNVAVQGGGIWSTGTLTLTNGTTSDNMASAFGGGIHNAEGTVNLANTIVAGNTAPTAPDCSGSPTSLGYNLIGNTSRCIFSPAAGDLLDIDPRLGPLQDNGGPTLIHALLPGSPAINAVPVANCTDTDGNPITGDQRGVSRPQGTDCDIGAYEFDIVVNSPDDTDDGACTVAHCSLREAIDAANANAGTDTIAFDIPGAGPHTIQPSSELPTITDPVIIDGYTQPGASPNTNDPGLGLNTVLMIELDGTNAGGAHGLNITAGSSTVKGLVINRFAGNGIWLAADGGNVVEGNFLGTDITGATALGNGQNGVIVIDSAGNTIGGPTPAARNLLSGNAFNGVVILFSSATDNLVIGNLIGTDITGTTALGNVFWGVDIEGAHSNTIGGTTAGERNVISGNGHFGLAIVNDATGNLVQGNFVGTDRTGANGLGNSRSGIWIEQASGNVIGGTDPLAGNAVAFNGDEGGVHVRSGTGNAILGNSTFSNTGWGIDLEPNGVTANDPDDADAGPNNLQNFPDISSATIDANGDLVIEYLVDSSRAFSTYPLRIEFFIADADGEEGEVLLGFDAYEEGSAQSVKAVNIGNAAALGVEPADLILATATDAEGNTSEFSSASSISAVGVCGDLNGDDLVNVFDAIIELQIIVGLIEPTVTQSKLGDLNGDGVINVFDAILMLQDIVGLTEITECGAPAP